TIFIAVWKFSPLVTALAVAGVIISAVYGLRSAANIFFGQPTDALASVTAQHPPADLNWSEKIPALVLFAALLFIGFWPRSISTSLNAALVDVAPAQIVSTVNPR